MTMNQTITIDVQARLLTKRHNFRVKIAKLLCKLASRIARAEVEITVDHERPSSK